MFKSTGYSSCARGALIVAATFGCFTLRAGADGPTKSEAPAKTQSQTLAPTMAEVIAQLEAAEARAAEFAFEIEARTSVVQGDGVTGGWHLKVLYDGSPYRRYHVDVFSEVGPWPDDPSGAGVADASRVRAFDGKVYQSLHGRDGSPLAPAMLNEGTTGRASDAFASMYESTVGWMFSLPGAMQSRRMTLSAYAKRCEAAVREGKESARAEVMTAEDGRVTLTLSDGLGQMDAFTIDPARGCAVVGLMREISATGIAMDETTITELAQLAEGVFYPKAATVRVFNDDGVEHAQSTFELVSARLIPKESLKDRDFQIDWPAGTRLANTDTKATTVIEPATDEAEPK